MLKQLLIGAAAIAAVVVMAPLDATPAQAQAALSTTTPTATRSASTLAVRLQGRILLDVQRNGEAWYIWPVNDNRYFMGRPADAFALMRNISLGITNSDLDKIPIGFLDYYDRATDTDSDGLSNEVEIAIGSNINDSDTDNDGSNDQQEIRNGTNVNGSGRLATDTALVNRLSGRILLQVQRNGEAWYLDPVSKKRYYLGRPSDAFAIMRNFGLGITSANLETIPVAIWSELPPESRFELPIFIDVTTDNLDDRTVDLDNGQDLVISYRNRDDESHNLVISGLNKTLPTVRPNDRVVFRIRAAELREGAFTMYDSLSNNRAQGMEATLTITIDND